MRNIIPKGSWPQKQSGTSRSAADCTGALWFSLSFTTRLHPQGKGGPKDTLCRISSDSVQPLDQFVHESYSWVRQILFRIDPIWSKKFDFCSSFWSSCTWILFLSPPKTGSQTVQMKRPKISFREPRGRNPVKCRTPRLWARTDKTRQTDRRTYYFWGSLHNGPFGQ